MVDGIVENNITFTLSCTEGSFALGRHWHLNRMTFLGAFGPGTEAPAGGCRIHFPYIYIYISPTH